MQTANKLLTAILLGATLTFGQTNSTYEFVVPRGATAGQIIRTVKIEKADQLLAKAEKQPTVALWIQGQRTNAPVELTVLMHDTVRQESRKDWPFTFCEFQIRSASGKDFEWSCWDFSTSEPTEFKVFTVERLGSYAFYVGRGIRVFRLTQSRQSSLMRGMFHALERHPDELPPLSISFLSAEIGRTNLVGRSSSTYSVAVDELRGKAGELQIVLHGVRPEIHYTFALRDGKWVFLNSRDNE